MNLIGRPKTLQFGLSLLKWTQGKKHWRTRLDRNMPASVFDIFEAFPFLPFPSTLLPDDLHARAGSGSLDASNVVKILGWYKH